MTDLIAFLSARLDEPGADETLARVIREIIRLREQAFDPRFDDDPWNSGYEAAMRDVLGQFAAVWGGHPDYRPEWAPKAS